MNNKTVMTVLLTASGRIYFYEKRRDVFHRKKLPAPAEVEFPAVPYSLINR
ncbi:hypothetical protein [Brevibacillus sp. 179-C9.3 HS]|uniref:hypothetical protein n=1 Tax=unclassified Brevibacillus TaxID=2684853 RepID=UPI0039A04C25